MHEVRQRSAPTLLAYQLARASAYAAFGAAFGALGHALDLGLSVTVSKLLPFLLVTLLISQALELRLDRFLPPLRLSRVTCYRPAPGVPLASFIGAITVLIPCGFLYSTAPLAMATGSAAGGAALLAAFALGTTPALVAAALLGSRPWLSAPRARVLRRALATIAALIIVGRLLVLQPAPAESGAAPTVHCHDLGP
jgi:sulfite exporter TauE/SafE